MKNKLLYLILVSSIFFPSNVYAFDKEFYQSNDILFYSDTASEETSNILFLPVINDEAKLIKTIDDYIKETVGEKSPYYGLGASFVKGAKATGLNPFVAVAHAQKESSLGTNRSKNWFTWVFSTESAAATADITKQSESFNGFGRSASESQSHVWYPGANGTRKVYKWASWKDSLEGEDSFFQYYKRVWIDDRGFTSFEQIIPQYAPESDGNDPNGYKSQMYAIINKLIAKAGDSISFNSISTNGLTLSQAKNFMNIYKYSSSSINFIGGASKGCSGGPLANCVSFSTYFINKYTSLKGFTSSSGHGKEVAKNVPLRNKGILVDNNPEAFSIFSRQSGGDGHGHTGVILGVDIEKNKLIIGEAGCDSPMSFVDAKEKDLKEWSSDDYYYAHITKNINNVLIKKDSGI